MSPAPRKSAAKDKAEAPEVEVQGETVEGTDEAALGSHTASVDTTASSKVIKYHSPPAATVPAVGSTVTGTGIGTNAVVVGSPEPTEEQFSVSVASTATGSAVTATFGTSGAPEQTGVLITSPADQAANGYYGRRQNAHSDDEFTVDGLVNGGSPGDWGNPSA